MRPPLRIVPRCWRSVLTVSSSYSPLQSCCCRYGSPKSISEQKTARIAGALLFVLALVVASTALLALVLHWRPETSYLGMIVTVAALAVMPILATLKRREARRTNNVALAADAVQSATCAYLALITLAGLAANACSISPGLIPSLHCWPYRSFLKKVDLHGREKLAVVAKAGIPISHPRHESLTHLPCIVRRKPRCDLRAPSLDES